jgi:SAM-dependent methyltransferase
MADATCASRPIRAGGPTEDLPSWPMDENDSRNRIDGVEVVEGDVDWRRVLWRRGSYEIIGDWLRPASVSVLDRVEQATGSGPANRSLLDVATGTGAVAIEAARRGAAVTAVDLTDELVAIAGRRACEAGTTVRFEVGDFDRLDDVVGGETFDIVTSSFGVIFAPDAVATARQMIDRLRPGGFFGVTAWDPDGVFIVPDTIIELFPERPRMPNMGLWATGIDSLITEIPARPVAQHVDVLDIEFESAESCAEQLELWAGGWAQLFETLDEVGAEAGSAARQRFVGHLRSFGRPSSTDSFVLQATYHTTVLQRV